VTLFSFDGPFDFVTGRISGDGGSSLGLLSKDVVAPGYSPGPTPGLRSSSVTVQTACRVRPKPHIGTLDIFRVVGAISTVVVPDILTDRQADVTAFLKWPKHVLLPIYRRRCGGINGNACCPTIAKVITLRDVDIRIPSSCSGDMRKRVGGVHTCEDWPAPEYVPGAFIISFA
jgi:hypothetical protein